MNKVRKFKASIVNPVWKANFMRYQECVKRKEYISEDEMREDVTKWLRQSTTHSVNYRKVLV